MKFIICRVYSRHKQYPKQVFSNVLWKLLVLGELEKIFAFFFEENQFSETYYDIFLRCYNLPGDMITAHWIDCKQFAYCSKTEKCLKMLKIKKICTHHLHLFVLVGLSNAIMFESLVHAICSV